MRNKKYWRHLQKEEELTRKKKQTKTLYSFSNWRYELLFLYKKFESQKSQFVCSRIFTLAQCTVRPDHNIKSNPLKFYPTTKYKLRDLLQQTDLKHLPLSGRYKCSKNKGHFSGSLSIPTVFPKSLKIWKRINSCHAIGLQ